MRGTEAGLTGARGYLGPAAWTDWSADTNKPPDHMFVLKDQSLGVLWYLLIDAPKIAI